MSKHQFNLSINDAYFELCKLWDNHKLYDFIDPNYINNLELELVSHFSDPTDILLIFKNQYQKQHQNQ